MQKRAFKSHMISALGMGCMRLPRLTGETIDRPLAQELIDYAYKNGINYYDTAYCYHDGESESFMGEALSKYDRSTYFLATKMPTWMLKTKEDVARIFDEQLSNLRTDYIDFYLVHNLTVSNWEITKNFDIINFLEQKRKEGKIRYLGFSFHDKPELLQEICDSHPFDFAQLQLNYIDWEMQDAKRQYEILEAHNLPCIVMEPVRGGGLAKLCDESEQIFRELDKNASTASFAMRYAASLNNVLTVLSGMSNLEQLKDNINTMTDFVPLSDKEREAIARASQIHQEKVTLPCTACRYCIDCEAGIDIPSVFAMYNQYKLGTHLVDFLDAIEKSKIEKCLACNKCSDVCPQKIDIPSRIVDISKLYASLV